MSKSKKGNQSPRVGDHQNNDNSELSRDAVSALRSTGQESVAEEKRPERIPVSGNRDVLTVQGKAKGYVYRWVNDSNDRLQRFIDGYWEFVTHGVRVGVRTINSSDNAETKVTKPVGGGVTAYLMRIKEEYYNEDQEAKARDTALLEESMLREFDDDEGFYGSIKTSRKRPRSF